MGDILAGIGIFIILCFLLLLLILWQRIHYEFEFANYETWSLQFRGDWLWKWLCVEVRCDGGAGLFWQVDWPFGGMDSHERTKAARKDAWDKKKKEALNANENKDWHKVWSRAQQQEEMKKKQEQKAEEQPSAEGQPAEKKKSTSVVKYLQVARYALEQGIVGDVARWLGRIWGRMLPRYAQGEAVIGLADAYTQGMLMGALYAALPKVAAHIQFLFTEEIMEGHIRVGGGIRPLALLWDTIRLLAAPSVRKTAWYYWRHAR